MGELVRRQTGRILLFAGGLQTLKYPDAQAAPQVNEIRIPGEGT